MEDTIPAIDAARCSPIAVVMVLKRYLQLKHRVQIGGERLKKLHTRVVGLVQDVVRHDVQQRENRIEGIGLCVIHTKNSCFSTSSCVEARVSHSASGLHFRVLTTWSSLGEKNHRSGWRQCIENRNKGKQRGINKIALGFFPQSIIDYIQKVCNG